jgi:hypothetical protein
VNGDGAIADADGKATYAATLVAGDAGHHQVIFGPGLTNPTGAEIFLFVRNHGPASADPDELLEQTSLVAGGCTPESSNGAGTGTYTCWDPYFAVFSGEATFNTNIFPFDDPTQNLGFASFTRSETGAAISANAHGLIAGHAYTMWWVIWNDPSQCAAACGEPDLGVTDNAVLFADGMVASAAGTASFAASLTVGGVMPGGPIPGALTDPISATIHLVIRDHGPALEGDALNTQLTEFEPTAADAASVGDGFAFDVQAAVSDGPE